MGNSAYEYLRQYRNMTQQINKCKERLQELRTRAGRTTQFQETYVSGTKMTRSLEDIVEKIEELEIEIDKLESRRSALRMEVTLNLATFVHDSGRKVTAVSSAYDYFLSDDLETYEDIGKRYGVTGKRVFGASKDATAQIDKALLAYPDRFTFYK